MRLNDGGGSTRKPRKSRPTTVTKQVTVPNVGVVPVTESTDNWTEAQWQQYEANSRLSEDAQRATSSRATAGVNLGNRPLGLDSAIRDAENTYANEAVVRAAGRRIDPNLTGYRSPSGPPPLASGTATATTDSLFDRVMRLVNEDNSDEIRARNNANAAMGLPSLSSGGVDEMGLVTQAVVTGAGEAADLAGRVLYRPALAALQGLDWAWENVVAEPIATAALATNYKQNPAFKDGFDPEDIFGMWTEARKAANDASWGVAVTSNPFIQAAASSPLVKQNPVIGYLFGFQEMLSPVIEGVNPWDPASIQRARDTYEAYNFLTGAYDLGLNFMPIPAGKGIGAAARVTGLTTKVREADRVVLRDDWMRYKEWKATNGASGQETNIGKQIQQIADSTDIGYILERPLVKNQSGAAKGRLADLYAKTSDPDAVFDIFQASIGDTQAIQRLLDNGNADLVYAIGGVGDGILGIIAGGGRYAPLPPAKRYFDQAHMDAVQRQEWSRAVWETFISETDEGAVFTVLGDWAPMAGRGRILPAPVTEAVARTVENTRLAAADLRAAMRTGNEEYIPAVADRVIQTTKGGPIVRLLSIRPGSLQWATANRPLNVVSFSGSRPDDVIEEAYAVMNQVDGLRFGQQFPVDRKVNPDGSVEVVYISAAQFRERAIARITQAMSRPGDATAAAFKALEDEIVVGMGIKHGVDKDDVERIVEGFRSKADEEFESLKVNGYFLDGQAQTWLDPVTLRQLRDSHYTLAINEIEAALRSQAHQVLYKVPHAIGSGARSAFNFGAELFRTNMLLKPGYTFRNSILEPTVTSIIAHGLMLFTAQGAGMFTKGLVNFGKNTVRRGKRATAGTVDAVRSSRLSARGRKLADEYNTLMMARDDLWADIEKRKILLPESYDLEQQEILDELNVVNHLLSLVTKDMVDEGIARSAITLRQPSFTRLSDEIRAMEDTLNGKPEHILAAEDAALAAASRGDDDAFEYWSARAEVLKEIEQISLGHTPSAGLAETVMRSDVPDDHIVMYHQTNVENLDSILKDGLRARNGSVWVSSKPYFFDEADAVRNSHMVTIKVAVPRSSVVGQNADRAREVVTGSIPPSNILSYSRVGTRTGSTMTKDDLAATIKTLRGDMRALAKKRKIVEDNPNNSHYARIESLNNQLDEIQDEMLKVRGLHAQVKARREKRATPFLQGEGQRTTTLANGQTITYDEAFAGPYGSAYRADASSAVTNVQAMNASVHNQTMMNILMSRFRRGRTGSVNVNDPHYFETVHQIAARHFAGDTLFTMIATKPRDEVIKWAKSDAGKRYFKELGVNGKAYMKDIDNAYYVFNRLFPTKEARDLVASGREFNVGELQDALMKPLPDGRRAELHDVIGQEIDYVVPTSTFHQAGSIYRRALDRIWDYIATQPETRLARWPYYVREFDRTLTDRMNVLARQGVHVDLAVANGQRRASHVETLSRLEKTFYNIRRYKNPVFTARFVMAFPGAFANSIYRYGYYLPTRHPANMVTLMNLTNAGFNSIAVDEFGNEADIDTAKYLLLPGTGTPPKDGDVFQTTGVRVPVDAMTRIFLDNPGRSYVTAIATDVALNLKPDLDAVMKKYLPDYVTAFLQNAEPPAPGSTEWTGGPQPGDALDVITGSLLANYQKTAIDWWRGTGSQKYLQDWGWAWQNVQAEKLRRGDTSPVTLEEVNEVVDGWTALRFLVQFASPTSYRIDAPGQLERDTWFRIREENPELSFEDQREMYYEIMGGDADDPLTAAERGKWAMPYTMSTSNDPYGMDNRYTIEALNAVRDHENLASILGGVHPELVGLLATGTGGSFSRAVYNNMAISRPYDSAVEPFRSKKMPQQYLTDWKVAEGWAEWSQSKQRYAAARKAAVISGDREYVKQLDEAWDFYRFNEDESLGPLGIEVRNPEWAIKKSLGTTDMEGAIASALELVRADKSFMADRGSDEDWQSVWQFLDDRKKVDALVRSLSNSDDDNAYKREVKDAFIAFYNEKSLDNPLLMDLWDRYFVDEFAEEQ